MGGSNERSGGVEDPVLRRTADARRAELQRRTTEALDRSAKLLEEAKELNGAGAKAERAEQPAQLRVQERDGARPPRETPPPRRETPRWRDRPSPRLEVPVGRVARAPAPSRSTGISARTAVPWALQPRIRTFLVLGIVGLPLLVALVASQILPSYPLVPGARPRGCLRPHSGSEAVARGRCRWADGLVLGWQRMARDQARSSSPLPTLHPRRHLGKHADRSDPRLEREGRLAGISALGAPAALRDRGSAPSPRYRLLRVLSAALDAALEPADPDRCDGLAWWRSASTYIPAQSPGGRSGPLTPRAFTSRCSGAWPCSSSLGACTWRPSRPSWCRHTQDRARPSRGRTTSTRTSGCSACAFSPTSRSSSAIGLAAAPFLASRGRVFAAKRAAIFPVAALVIVAIVSESWAPTLLQRYVVNTNPVAKEAPFLEHAIAGTRQALGLAGVDVHRFVPTARITSAEIRHDRSQLDNVQLWDTNILRAPDAAARERHAVLPARRSPRSTRSRPRRLAADAHRRARARCRSRAGAGRGWDNSRLVYTHGFGAFRFSGTRFDRAGGPSRTTGRFPSGSHASTSADSSRTRRTGWR